ncbi:MAG: ABC transporter permease, partial [Bacteroidota bacterium]
MLKRYFHDIQIAVEALKTNKLKSILTALGILFGVASVISMLAIGQGARQEILQQMETIGANNIVIEAKLNDTDKDKEADNGDEEQSDDRSSRFSPGLSNSDYNALKTLIPNIVHISPEIILESTMIHEGRSKKGKGIGISNDYLDIYNLNIAEGKFFTPSQEKQGKPVCILGNEVATQLFRESDPIGKYMKFGHVWLKVVGVLEPEVMGDISFEKYGLNNRNKNIFIPEKTLILRMKNRESLNYKPSSGNGFDFYGGGFDSGLSEAEEDNNHSYDRIIIKVNKTEQLSNTADLTDRILKRRHNEMQDYEIIVPELLLKQKQEAREIFNFVLGAIAGISLLVGGIGIMNIMFAT